MAAVFKLHSHVEEPKNIRQKILELAEEMRHGLKWVELAKLLEHTRDSKLFLVWGCGSFRNFCEDELWFGKTQAYDMLQEDISSGTFLNVCPS